MPPNSYNGFSQAINTQEKNKMENHQVKVKYEQFDDGECAICYSAPHVDKTSPPCGHVFCYQCLKNWIKHSATCPVCVKRFSEIKHGDQIELIPNQHRRILHVPFVINLLFAVTIALSFWIIWWHYYIFILVPQPFMYKMEEQFNFPFSKVHIMSVIIYTIFQINDSYHNRRLARPYSNMLVSIIISVIMSWILFTWWYYAVYLLMFKKFHYKIRLWKVKIHISTFIITLHLLSN